MKTYQNANHDEFEKALTIFLHKIKHSHIKWKWKNAIYVKFGWKQLSINKKILKNFANQHIYQTFKILNTPEYIFRGCTAFGIYMVITCRQILNQNNKYLSKPISL